MFEKIFQRLRTALSNKMESNEHMVDELNKNTNFSETFLKEGVLYTTYKNKNKVKCRMYPHSDFWVLTQILLNEEYRPAVDFILNNSLNRDDLNIIDAGANVGYSTVYFNSIFPTARIIAIEPDESNMRLVVQNTSAIDDSKKILIKSGLMGVPGVSLTVNNKFRDGKDWSITVEETNLESGLPSVSIPSLIEKYNLGCIDLLKIDIEGAERFVFNEEVNLDYLSSVKLIVLEIHDEFNIRQSIYTLFKERGFILFDFGETTLAVNKAAIK